jgi:hypothetical protein
MLKIDYKLMRSISSFDSRPLVMVTLFDLPVVLSTAEI